MGRWEPDAQGRLVEAAMELFAERGYEQTTVAEIAARAGLTERTFFRHYPDKREVLFAGGTHFRENFVETVRDAPDALSPLQVVSAAAQRAATALEEARGRDFAAARQRLILANPELRERELIKLADVSEGMAEALRERGVAEPDATLAAQLGMTAFRVAFERWVSDGERRPIRELVQEAFGRLPVVVG